jgi:hypothetical protein
MINDNNKREAETARIDSSQMMTPTEAKNNIREIVLNVMMAVGKFEPHTREEAERLRGLDVSQRLKKQSEGFDPGI